jgi:hypothetical protein
MFPWKYFFSMRKKGGNKKRVVYERGVSCTVRSPEVQEHPSGHSLKYPSLSRTHLYQNLPYNIIYTNTPIVMPLPLA